MANVVKLVVRDPDAGSDPTAGLELLEMPIGNTVAPLADDRQAVAVFVFFENPVGNQVAVEHSGHEIFSADQKDGSKNIIGQRDTTGGSAGGQLRTYTTNTAVGPQRQISKNASATVCAGSTAWEVYEGGDGTDYDDALDAARVLAGFPA